MAKYLPPETLAVGNGAETVFGFTFPYLRAADLAVTVNGAPVPVYLVGTAQLYITPAPAAGARIRIYRDTPAQFPAYQFSTGIPMLPKYIDENNRQLLYALQEGLLQFAQTEAKAAEALATANQALLASAAAAESAAQQARDMARTVRVPTTDPVINPLPDATTRANKIMAFNAAGQPIVVLPGSGSASDVMIELAKPAGAGYIGWERAPRTPLGTGVAGYLDNTRLSLWEPRFVGLAVKPNPMDPATWDWGPAIQAAIDYIINLAIAKGSTYGVPTLIVPAYNYLVGSRIKTVPWVKIQFEGASVWDFKNAPAGGEYVTIGSSSMVVPAATFSSTGACMAGAAGGTLLIQGGATMATNTSAGLFIGNKVDGQSVVREVGLVGISVRGCNRAIEFGKYGTYLFNAMECHFEHNFYNLVTPEGTVRNSGERMVFTTCIFAGSGVGGASILFRCDTFDLFFTTCSFDFNHDIIRCDNGATYATITLSNCHLEGWDGYIVNWQASGGANFYITLDTCTILPTTYRTPSPLVQNSPSRPLVRFGTTTQLSRCEVRFKNPVFRFTYLPWTEDAFLSVNEQPTTDPTGRRAVSVTGYTPYSYSAHGTMDTVSVMDYDFQKDPVGTAVSAMSCWERGVTPNLVSSDSLADDGTGKKVLAVVGTGISSYAFYRSKHRYPVQPGQTAYVWSACSRKGLTQPEGSDVNLPNLQLGVEYEYADGSKVRGPFVVYSMGRQFRDTAMPNYAEGEARYISSGSAGTLIPAGVVAVRPYIGYTNFVGTLYVSRIGLWLQ